MALTPLGLAVLELLAERPMHPYEMQLLMRERRMDRVVKLRRGSLYHTVERLDRAGLIAAAETARAGRRPERTVYALTEAGRDALTEDVQGMLRDPAEEYPAFAVALAYMHELTREQARHMLELRVVAVESEIAKFETLLEQLRRIGLARLHMVELEYAQAMRRAELGFVRRLIQDIESKNLRWNKGYEKKLSVVEPAEESA